MVNPLLQVFLLLATAILGGLGHPEDLGGLDLDEEVIDVDPTVGEGNKEDSRLEVRYDQVLESGENLNRMEEENFGYQPKNAWTNIGNDVFHLRKRSDAEERRMDDKIRILKKRDNFNMDGKIRILKKRDNFNMDGKIRILKKRDNFNMDGKIRILKKRDNFNMDGKIRILKKRDNFNMDGKIRILKKRDNFNMDGKIRIL